MAAKCNLPDGVHPLDNQVGGHFFKSSSKLGMLESNGFILKPCQNNGRGDCEKAFYEELFKSSDDDILMGLRPHLSLFYGVCSLEQFQTVEFLRLEDITKVFNKPSLMDLKIGPITCSPTAPMKKRESAQKKFPPLPEVGFTPCGVRIYDRDANTFTKLDKHYLRALTADEIYTKGFVTFFNRESRDFHPCVIVSILERLYRLLAWFEKQTRFHFYSTSLLLVYEGDILLPPSRCTSCRQYEASCDQLRSKLNDSGQEKTMSSDKRVTSDAISTRTQIENIKILREKAASDDDPTLRSEDSETTGSGHDVITQNLHHCQKNTDKNQQISVSEQLIDVGRSFADVRMIDFAHVFPACTKKDDNYIFGLKSVIMHLEKVLEFQ